MKDFDLELAMKGHRVCTASGKRVKLMGIDDDQLVGKITNGNGAQEILYWSLSGKSMKNENDLKIDE